MAAESIACRLERAAPLAAHLNGVAFDWALQERRPMSPSDARRILCSSDPSPCALLNNPRTLIDAILAAHPSHTPMLSSMPSSASVSVSASTFEPAPTSASAAASMVANVPTDAPRPATTAMVVAAAPRLHVVEVGRPSPQHAPSVALSDALATAKRVIVHAAATLEAAATEHQRTCKHRKVACEGVDLLVVWSKMDAHRLLAELRPTLALVLSCGSDAWCSDEQLTLLAGLPYSSFLVPANASSVKYEGECRRLGRMQHPRAELVRSCQWYAGAVHWRRPPDCSPPLFDLRRDPRYVTAAETAAAAAAAAAGVSYTEWYACNTLHPLRNLVRSLFVHSRAFGRSVWRACILPPVAGAHSSPCQWFIGNHSNHESFARASLTAPDVLLERLSAHREAAVAAEAAAVDGADNRNVRGSHRRGGSAGVVLPRLASLPPPLMLDVAAGEGNYTEHLPDGMGTLPALQLIRRYPSWTALLLEPAPPAFTWLQHNFAAFASGPSSRVKLRRYGVTTEAAAQNVTIWSLAPALGELEAKLPHGLPVVTRQRLQFGSSVNREVPAAFSRDLWQMNHLAGGHIAEALRQGGYVEEANAFDRCKGASAACERKTTSENCRCFGLWIEGHSAVLLPLTEVINRDGVGDIDMLVVDIWDGSGGVIMRSFPFEKRKPSLVLFRNGRGTRTLVELMRLQGYEVSAHWETRSWGEMTLAWRADRCPGVQLRSSRIG